MGYTRSASCRSNDCASHMFIRQDSLDQFFRRSACLATVTGKSVFHYHRNSGWQRTERRRVYGDTGMMETDWASPGVRRYRVSGDGRSDGEYIFRRPRARYHVSHIISYHYSTNYTLYLSHLLISLALSGTPCGSTQLHGSSQPGSIIP